MHIYTDPSDGSERGVVGNGDPYRDPCMGAGKSNLHACTD